MRLLVVEEAGERVSGEGAVGVESIFDTVVGIWRAFLEHLPLFAAGVLILFVTWAVSGVLARLATRALSHSRMRASLQELIERLLYMAIWALGLIVAAMIVFPGLTPTRALAGLGLGSIAVGFAFKDIFENFFAGILILWRFPLEKGDFIECGEIMGRVEDITVRNMLIRRTSGELVVVPNATIFKNALRVLTNREIRRVEIETGIAYDESIPEAREVIEKAVSSCESVSREEPVEVFARRFGSSSIDFQVTWWTGATPVEVRESRNEVVTAVKAALDDAGIEIPFPYRTLTFKEPVSLAAER